MKPVLLALLLASIHGLSLAQTVLKPADLGVWKLTLPLDENGDGRADEVKQLDGYENPPWFKPVKDGIVFRANAGGARTSQGTAYARSELREMTAGGQPAAWDCTGDTRSLFLEQALLHTTTAKPEATLGQIHDAKNDNLMLKYSGPKNANGISDTGRIDLLWNDAAEREALDPAYALGDVLQVKIAVDKGQVQVDYRNLRSGLAKRVEARLDPASVKGACYFKVGVYIQACSKLDSRGEANAQCAKKGWREERFDAADAYAEVLIKRIEM